MEDRPANQIQETALCGLSVLPFTAPVTPGRDRGSPYRAGQGAQGLPWNEGPSPLRHPDLGLGGDPPLALRAWGVPTHHRRLSWGWGARRGAPSSCDLAPRPGLAQVLSPTHLCPLWRLSPAANEWLPAAALAWPGVGGPGLADSWAG